LVRRSFQVDFLDAPIAAAIIASRIPMPMHAPAKTVWPLPSDTWADSSLSVARCSIAKIPIAATNEPNPAISNQAGVVRGRLTFLPNSLLAYPYERYTDSPIKSQATNRHQDVGGRKYMRNKNEIAPPIGNSHGPNGPLNGRARVGSL